MTVPEVDYSKIDEVSEEASRLFKVMMRLEFALKDVGILCSRSKGSSRGGLGSFR